MFYGERIIYVLMEASRCQGKGENPREGLCGIARGGEDEKTLQTCLRLQLMPLIPPPWISLLCPPRGPAEWSGLTTWVIHSASHLSSAQKHHPYTSLPPACLLPSTLPSPTAPLTSSPHFLPTLLPPSPHFTSSSAPAFSSATTFMRSVRWVYELQNSLDNIQNSVFEVRRDMKELLIRDKLREHREERLETLICTLLHTTLDTGTSSPDIAHDPQMEQKPGPSSR
jgi:hypothetical protein